MYENNTYLMSMFDIIQWLSYDVCSLLIMCTISLLFLGIPYKKGLNVVGFWLLDFGYFPKLTRLTFMYLMTPDLST